jgi:hypothetical protein
MNNWIIRIPEPMPLGLTRLEAMIRATSGAVLVNVPGGGKVETVLIFPDHFFFASIAAPARIPLEWLRPNTRFGNCWRRQKAGRGSDSARTS